MADSHEVQRRDFVNIILVGLSSVIAMIIGIPAIGYLLSPAIKTQEQDYWYKNVAISRGAFHSHHMNNQIASKEHDEG